MSIQVYHVTAAPWASASLVGSGSGFQPAMVRAHSRACALSVRPREQPAQLHRSREFAALLIDGADRSLVLLGDDEHRAGAWGGMALGPQAERHGSADVQHDPTPPPRRWDVEVAKAARALRPGSLLTPPLSLSMGVSFGTDKTFSTTFRSRFATSKSAWMATHRPTVVRPVSMHGRNVGWLPIPGTSPASFPDPLGRCW